MTYQIAQQADSVINIKVLGVGGAGGHILNRMTKMSIPHVQYVAINTDTKAIYASEAGDRLLIGKELTGGLGAGGDEETGRKAAEAAQDRITNTIRGCDMVFLTAGLGGGVGTGALPVIAKLSKALGILTVAVVTLPFSFEGKERRQRAEFGLAQLREAVDALIVIPNDNLKQAANEKLTFTNAFDIADRVLSQTVQNTIDLIQRPAYINTDFADVTSILQNAGSLHVSFAQASGITRAETVLRDLLHNTLLGTSISNAKGILLCVTASSSVRLDEIESLSEGVREAAGQEANIIFGMDFDEALGNTLQAMVLATGASNENSVV